MSYNFNYSSIPILSADSLGYIHSQSASGKTISTGPAQTIITFTDVPIGVYILSFTGSLFSSVPNAWSCFFEDTNNYLIYTTLSGINNTQGSYIGDPVISYAFSNNSKQNYYIKIAQTSTTSTTTVDGKASLIRIA